MGDEAGHTVIPHVARSGLILVPTPDRDPALARSLGTGNDNTSPIPTHLLLLVTRKRSLVLAPVHQVEIKRENHVLVLNLLVMTTKKGVVRVKFLQPERGMIWMMMSGEMIGDLDQDPLQPNERGALF